MYSTYALVYVHVCVHAVYMVPLYATAQCVCLAHEVSLVQGVPIRGILGLWNGLTGMGDAGSPCTLYRGDKRQYAHLIVCNSVHV